MLDEREIFQIREQNTKAPNGYNLTDGGEGLVNPSEETRARMSANHADVSGKNNPIYGKPRSPETKAKIKANLPDMRGEKNPHYGKPHSDESKAKMSAACKGKPSPRKGKPHSPETCAKISAARKAYCVRKKLESQNHS